MLKAWSTLYLLSFLDSVLKAIGEAVAVLVIYFMEVLLPVFDTTFQPATFLAVMVVILSVTSYLGSTRAVETRPNSKGALAREAWLWLSVIIIVYRAWWRVRMRLCIGCVCGWDELYAWYDYIVLHLRYAYNAMNVHVKQDTCRVQR